MPPRRPKRPRPRRPAPLRADGRAPPPDPSPLTSRLAASPQVDASLLRTELELLLKLTLLPLERDVMRLRYGLDDGISKSLEAVGTLVGLRTQRVRTIEQSCFRRLRKPSILSRLEHFNEEMAP